jgi:hypothetical protein
LVVVKNQEKIYSNMASIVPQHQQQSVLVEKGRQGRLLRLLQLPVLPSLIIISLKKKTDETNKKIRQLRLQLFPRDCVNGSDSALKNKYRKSPTLQSFMELLCNCIPQMVKQNIIA